MRRVQSRWAAECALFKSAPPGEEELNQYVRALNVFFERPGYPRQTRAMLSQVFKSLSPTCADATKQSQCAASWDGYPFLDYSFLFQRIFLHSDTHRQSHCEGSCDYTADSFFVHAPGEEIAKKKREQKESVSIYLAVTTNLEPLTRGYQLAWAS